MTIEEILAAAKEAGFGTALYSSGIERPNEEIWGGPMQTQNVINLVKIIEKRTIEKCAAVCDVEWNGDSDTYEYSIAANDLAAAIRALGEQ